MSKKRKCIRDLEAMRASLHEFFHTTQARLIEDLLKYADDLDVAYRDIKISKIAGQSGCVVGGVLAVVGFGLSFATFGASLGLCIAGAVIGGAGGVTSGGASIAEFVKAKAARKKAEEQLKVYNEELSKLLQECKEVSNRLERIGDIDKVFPCWCEFWTKLMFGSVKAVTGFGWKMVANTIINAIRIGKTVDIATDVTSTILPVFRTLGNTAKGFHIAGGVASAVFLPWDVYSLVSNSVELHKNEAHETSKTIRKAVSKIQHKCPKKQDIDDMIDECIAELRKTSGYGSVSAYFKTLFKKICH